MTKHNITANRNDNKVITCDYVQYCSFAQ